MRVASFIVSSRKSSMLQLGLSRTVSCASAPSRKLLWLVSAGTEQHSRRQSKRVSHEKTGGLGGTLPEPVRPPRGQRPEHGPHHPRPQRTPPPHHPPRLHPPPLHPHPHF